MADESRNQRGQDRRPEHRAADPASYEKPGPAPHQAGGERPTRRRAGDEHRARPPGAGEGGWRASWEQLRDRERMRSWMQRQRAHTSKLRKPLIGLAVAGAAAPLVRSSVDADRDQMPDTEQARISDRPGAGEDAESATERFVADEAKRVRGEVIQGAMNRYGISENLASDIHDIAKEEGIEPRIAFGLVKTESTFRHRAVSHVGARGLTQLMPRTAKWMMPEIGNEQMFEQETNLRVGFRYLRYLVDKYKGDMELALLAYNRGPGTVDRVLSRGGNPDNGYARKVMGG